MAADKKKILRALQKIPLWLGLSGDELEQVYHRCTAVTFENGETIFEEGTASHDLYIVLSGHIDIVTAKKGVIHTVFENETFGEIGLITQNPRSASAVSTTAGSLLKLNHVEFNTLLGTAPRISALMMRNITTGLSEHIVRMNQSQPDYLPTDKKDQGLARDGSKTDKSVVLSNTKK